MTVRISSGSATSTGCLQDMWDDTAEEITSLRDEIVVECLPTSGSWDGRKIWSTIRDYVCMPHAPCLNKGGWLAGYLFDTKDSQWLRLLLSDVSAGIVTAMLLIPQALSYANLASLPPILGLYAVIIPGFIYAVFGGSMHLSVGPVAIVSLLTSSVIASYGVAPRSPEAVELAGELSVAVGLTLCTLSLLNCGFILRYISSPALSGFTTGAASLIGLSQLRQGFGVISA